jgi:hypothetical protein
MSKISTIGQDFFTVAVAAYDKGMDKMLSRKVEGKPLTGSFSFKYEIPEEFITYTIFGGSNYIQKLKEITVKVSFKSIKRDATAYKGSSTSHDTKKNIIFNNDISAYQSNETIKASSLTVYIHELQHIAQDYNGFGDLYYSNLHHSQRPIEHEACLTEVLYQMKYMGGEAAAEIALKRAEYMQYSFRKFIQKAYAFGCTSNQIMELRSAVAAKMNEKANHPFYDKIHQDYHLLVMLGVGKNIINNFVEKETARLETEKHPRVIGWINNNIKKFTKLAAQIN